MKIINVKISNKIAICPKRYLVSSNDDYIIRFDFDEQWEQCKDKIARLMIDGETIDIPFLGTDVKLPKIPVFKELCIGVFSKNLASTYAELGCIVSCAD